MEWLKQLSSAISYIEDNLAGEISYQEAAKIACCSTYYFQRMFSYVADISLSEYIRRRRMTQAAFDLQSTDSKIFDVALKYGYSSPTSFNRAFQKVHGMSPGGTRLPGSTLSAYLPIHFSVTTTGGSAMPYRIEAKQAMRLVGARIPLTEEMEENQVIVPEFWNKSLKENKMLELRNCSNGNPNGLLGVTAYENPNKINYYIAVASDGPVPEGMYEYEIPAATWVVFEHEGHFKESVQAIFKRFLTEWLPFSNYEYAMLPDIEVYPINEDKNKQGRLEVWIAVKGGSKG